MRTFSPKELVHERLGRRFDTALSDYDTRRRVEVLVADFMSGIDLTGKRALDVGTGLGFFAEALQLRGARVTAVDIGETMLERVHRRLGCECRKADALALTDLFGPESFDIVVSSECIEHTPSPREAIRQMSRVVRPGGYLSLSTPNLVWLPAVRLATALGVRPFDGLENFSTFGSVRTVLKEEGMAVVKERGLHLIPFQLPARKLSTWLDENAQWLRFLMINICVLSYKPPSPGMEGSARAAV
jgi:SAM-dependent methyltransferase